MYKHFNVLMVVVVMVSLMLAGCFRQSSPDISPSIQTLPPATLIPTDEPVTSTPFITPFATGQGPDMTGMPTLNPTETVALVQPGTTTETESGDDGAVTGVSTQPSVLGATPTIPFAAGATYTPAPGAPPVNLNPNVPTPTNASVQTGAAASEADDCVYRVQSGDTAFYIATLHGITLDQLIQYNRLDDPNRLVEGQELEIPNCGETAPTNAPVQAGPTSVIQPPAATPTDMFPQNAPDGSPIHVVQAGENLFRISLRYGVSMEAIVAANNLSSTEAILSVGQQLIIPSE